MAQRDPTRPDRPASDRDAATLARYAEEDHRNIARRVRLGLGTQILSLGSLVVARLLLVPFFLTAWGSGKYGEWLILEAAAGLLQFVTCGQQTLYGNRIRSAWAVRDHADVRRNFAQGWTFFIVAGVFLVVAIGTFSLFVAPTELFHLRYLTQSETIIILLCLTFKSISLQARALLFSIYLAKGELHIAELIQTFTLLAETLIIAIFLIYGAAPTTVALLLVSITVIVITCIFLLDFRQRISWLSIFCDFNFIYNLKPSYIYAYGVPHVATHLGTFLPAVLLGLFSFRGSDVVLFNLTRNFTSLLRLWATQVAQLSAVELSRQEFQRDFKRQSRFFRTSSLKFAIAVGVVGGVMFGLVDPIFRIWTAGRIEPAMILLVLLMMRTIASSIGQYWLAAMRLSDHMEAAARTGVGYIIVSLIGSLVGIEFGGLIGLACGLLIADLLFTMLWPAFLYIKQIQNQAVGTVSLILAAAVGGFGFGWVLGTLGAPVLDAAIDRIL